MVGKFYNQKYGEQSFLFCSPYFFALKTCEARPTNKDSAIIYTLQIFLEFFIDSFPNLTYNNQIVN